jgi:phosphotransferase system  glucose/maltose/N-acetylglucosamine-specific IIC component
MDIFQVGFVACFLSFLLFTAYRAMTKWLSIRIAIWLNLYPYSRKTRIVAFILLVPDLAFTFFALKFIGWVIVKFVHYMGL